MEWHDGTDALIEPGIVARCNGIGFDVYDYGGRRIPYPWGQIDFRTLDEAKRWVSELRAIGWCLHDSPETTPLSWEAVVDLQNEWNRGARWSNA